MSSLGAERASVEGAHGKEDPRPNYVAARTGLTHDASPRQLPTDHDHDGEPRTRSANIRVINRRVSYLDRRLLCCGITGGIGSSNP